MRYSLLVVCLAACASDGAWMEGDQVNAEVRRILGTSTGGVLGLSLPSGLYAVPPGRLEKERRGLLTALADAVPVRSSFPEWEQRNQIGVVASAPRSGQRLGRPPPPPGEAIHVWASPAVLEMEFPAGALRVLRLAIGGDVFAYGVELGDRRFGTDRSVPYRVRLLSSPDLNRAWNALVHAAERGATHHHYWTGAGQLPDSPLKVIRGFDDSGLRAFASTRTR